MDREKVFLDLKEKKMWLSILKKIGLAFLMIAIVVFLANIFRPENASTIGSGFTRIIPAMIYPFKFVLGSATIFLILSFLLKPKSWKIAYVLILLINLAYLFYCIQTYVEN